MWDKSKLQLSDIDYLAGVFLIPRRSGGGKLDVKRTRRGWFAPRIHALHQYIAHHRSDNRSVTAFFSRDHPLPRDIFPSRFKGHDTMIDRRLSLRSRILSIILVFRAVALNYRWKNKNKTKQKIKKGRLFEEKSEKLYDKSETVS